MQLLCGKCGEIVNVSASPRRGETTVNCPRCSRAIPIPGMCDDDPNDSEPNPPQEEAGFAEQARASTLFRIRVTCRICGKSFTVNGRLAGQRTRCPKCSKPVVVPYPDDDIDVAPLVRGAAGPDGPADAESPDASAPRAACGHPAAVEAHSPPGPARPDIPSSLPTDTKTRRANVLVLASLALAIALGLLAYLVIPKLLTPLRVVPTITDTLSSPPNGQPPVEQPADAAPTAPPLATSRPLESVAPTHANKPHVTIISAKADIFAAGGYYPASPGRIYLKVTAQITATDKPIMLVIGGDDVALDLPTGRLSSLGLVTDGASLARSEVSTRRIGAHKTLTLTFLFDAPVATQGGRLTIRGAGSAAMPQLNVPAIPKGAILGRFNESPPRNLKPLMRDPVIAAIQAAGQLRMHIRTRRRRKGIFVSLGPLRSETVATPAGNGVYDVTFTSDQHKLKCKLRLAPGGRTLVLYLGDKPFHQITFTKTR